MKNRIIGVSYVAAAALMAACFVSCGSSGTNDSIADDFVLSSDQDDREEILKSLFTEGVYLTITEKSRSDPRCKEANREELGLPDLPNGEWYYTYDNLIEGMATMEKFGTESEDDNTNKLEIAAFLANIAQETGAGVDIDPVYGGLGCFIQEGGGSARDSCIYGGCVNTPGYDNIDTCKAHGNKCPAGDIGWSGRGPHQLSWPSNYLEYGRAMGEGNSYMNDPDLLTQRSDIGIPGSIWFWGYQENSDLFPPDVPFKPSAHNVVSGSWEPTEFDVACGRTKPSLGVITNLINGGIECGPNATEDGRQNAARRVLYFNAIANAMGVQVPDGWADDCSGQKNFQECPSYMDESSRCGVSWSVANTTCGTLCTDKSHCPAGEECYSDLSTVPCEI